MSSTQPVLAGSYPESAIGPGRSAGRRRLRGAELRWAIAFISPYAAVFLAFVVYPFGYALWMAGRPSLYAELFSDPLYLSTLVNTVLFVGFGVNVKMFLALLLSGFFLRRRWWIRALLVPFILPWLIATAQACVSFHWMLIDQRGLLDGLLSAMFGIDGPIWFNNRALALGSNIVAYIWKWLPFWTLVSTLWTLGDFTTVYLVSGGAPALTTHVLATLGYHYAFIQAKPPLGIAAVLSALPVLIPIAIVLMRRLQTSEVQL
jgi:multiple sugar transport system permease protein